VKHRGHALRVLLVEDSEDDAVLLLRELRRGGYDPVLERVDTAGEMLAALDGGRWDIVIADYVLPGFSGLAALRLMQGRDVDLPFIVVSGKVGAEIAVEAMKNGADDFIAKGNFARLVPAIERELRYAEVRSERRRAEEQLRESEEKYHRVFTEARDGIALIDAETGHIVDCNPAFEIQTGRTLKQLKAMRTWELRPPDKIDLARQRFLEVVKKGPSGLAESELLKPDGEIIPIEFASKVVSIASRKYLQTICRDITERRRAEAALHDKDQAIRQAYVDVFSAVTGGRLIIMTREEIESSLGRSCAPIWEIASGKDVGIARDRLREALDGSISGEKLEEVLLAASEAMTNAFKHAGAGQLLFCKSKRSSQVVVTDSGPGIDFSILPKATLLSGFSTKPSLGMGFSIMLELCDKVKLATEPGYTGVVLEIGA